MNRTLEDRVARLERTNRWMLGLCAALVAVPLLMLAGWQAKTADAVRAEKFEVVDDSGRVRAELSVPDAGARLRLYDEDGTMRVLLAAPVNGHEVLALDDGAGNASAPAGPGHGPGLLLLGESGRLRVWLTGHDDIDASLHLMDKRGRETAVFPPDKP